jgi:hypothetical protein
MQSLSRFHRQRDIISQLCSFIAVDVNGDILLYWVHILLIRCSSVLSHALDAFK